MEHLRRVHNDIKLDLLRQACSGMEAPSVLDLGCGVGGDIVKYLRCGCSYVLGMDTDGEAIREARRRLADTATGEGTTIQFLHVDGVIKGMFLFAPRAAFDVVWCQFALHFLVEEGGLEPLAREIHRVLREGGVFAASILQGDLVLGLLGNDRTYEDGNMRIALDGERSARIHLKSTRFYSDREGEVSERLLLPDDIVQPVIDAGFSLAHWKNFSEYTRHVQGYPPALNRISSLYSTFIFRRR